VRPLSNAQKRVLAFLERVRQADIKRGVLSAGWIEFWDIAQECGSTVPLGLLPNSFSKTITALESRWLIERNGESFRIVAGAA